MPDRFAAMTQEPPDALSVTADALHMPHSSGGIASTIFPNGELPHILADGKQVS